MLGTKENCYGFIHCFNSFECVITANFVGITQLLLLIMFMIILIPRTSKTYLSTKYIQQLYFSYLSKFVSTQHTCTCTLCMIMAHYKNVIQNIFHFIAMYLKFHCHFMDYCKLFSVDNVQRYIYIVEEKYKNNNKQTNKNVFKYKISRQWYAISCKVRLDEHYCTHIKYDELVDRAKTTQI